MSAPLICEKCATDVSRCGEYTFCRAHLTLATPPYVVDVGAYGKRNSNSWNLIHDHNWNGLLIEPQPDLAQQCREQFHGNVVVEQVAVSDHAGEALFYRYKTKGWGSLNADHAPRKVRRRKPIRVDVVTLPSLLEKYNIPHYFGLLSIDAEGMDQTILKTVFDSPWRPELIVIETCETSWPTNYGYELLHCQSDQQIWRKHPIPANIVKTTIR